jgi:hypothetical protein
MPTNIFSVSARRRGRATGQAEIGGARRPHSPASRAAHQAAAGV